MSNHLAIATVTAALRQRLSDAVVQDVSGASVEVMPLNDPRLRDTTAMLNVFLYHIGPNTAWRNADLPTRREDGTLSGRPTLALNLYYLLTAFGRSTQTDSEAHRLLGSAVRTLHERPVLLRSEIASVVQATASLAGSNLADQAELVRFTPQSLSLEELSKLWSVFFQTPYRISTAYEASVVLIDGEATPRPTLPVQARNIYVVTLRAPVVEAIEALAGPREPILPEDEVVIRGANLRGDVTRVRIGTTEITPIATDVRDGQIEIALPPTLRAGVQGLQVVQPMMMGTPETEHIGKASNLAAFVLRPRILRNAGDTDWLIAVNVTSGTGNQPRTGTMTVTLAPEIGREQRVVLFLNQFGAAPGQPSRAFSFQAPSRREDPAETTDSIEFAFEGVTAATYIVRVQVDGAESPLLIGVGGEYDEPRTVIS